jgi:formamidopyrimidine-DNA glycosylase
MIPMDMWDFREFVRACVETGQTDEIIKILTEENVIPQGEWKLKIQRPYYVYDRRYYYCSNCNSEIHYSDLGHNCPIFSNYCPNCGAKLCMGEQK